MPLYLLLGILALIMSMQIYSILAINQTISSKIQFNFLLLRQIDIALKITRIICFLNMTSS